MTRSYGGDYEDGYNAGYADGLIENSARLAALSSFEARTRAAEQRAERLAVAGRAFVEAWEKCHQLEKTDVAYRLMVDALADNKSSAESSNRCPHCNAADTEYGPHHVKECPNWTPF